MGLKKFKKKKTKSKGKLSKSNENHPSKFMILVVVLSALIVSLLFFSIIYLDKFKNSIDGKIISVPNVEGLEADKAVKKLESSGFSVDYSNEKYSDKVKKGHVLSQTNKEGEELKEGYTIGIVISKGAELVKVPNVVHEEYVSGKLILENKSLVLGEVEYEYSDLPKDTIIEQIPKADTEVNQNTKINLVISEGSKNNYVLMPSLKSLTVEEARNRLSKINLKLGSVTYNPSLEFEDGEIHWQSVKNGSDISEGNTINVVVTRNNNSENNDSEDVVSDDDEDPDLISKPFIIPLDFDEESKVIKVEKVQDGTSKIVYQKEHSKSEGSVRVMVKAKGEVTIKFYYGDELISQQNKNFE